MGSSGRQLRNVRIRSAIRAFQRSGYKIIRVRGSHYILRHPERGFLVLPFHRGTVKAGILFDALEKADISVEEFVQLL